MRDRPPIRSHPGSLAGRALLGPALQYTLPSVLGTKRPVMPTPQRLLEFFSNHPGLVMAFLAVLGALIWTLFQGGGRGVKKVNPSDAIRLVNSEDAIVIDVRGESEFKKGHILNSVHVPQNYLKDHLAKLEKHRQQPVIMACRTGSESARAGAVLVGHGFEKVYTLNGGILAWEAASLPLVKD